MSLIELHDIQKRYQMGDTTVYALRGVSLSIEAGDFVAIMGPSGSGKSTMMNVLGLLDVPDQGSYKLDGREVSGLDEDELAILRRDAVGFIFQQFHLLPRMDAEENVTLPLLYSKRGNGTQKAIETLNRVGLGSRTHHRPNELSGGQQQRVAIARALANDPTILFADEPTGNLDSQSEHEIIAILKDLNASGITVIMVTHEEEIGSQAKRRIRMRDGVVLSDERLQPLSANNALTHKIPALGKSSFQLSDISSYLVHGFRALGSNKVRTALSMLGILIGVAAVVAMLGLGTGAQKALEEQLTSLGSNLLVLRPPTPKASGVALDPGSVTRITNDDVQAIREKIEHINAVSPAVDGRAQVTYLDKNWSTSISGTGSAYGKIHNSVPDIGNFFTDVDNEQRARVAVIGRTILRELFGDANAIGEMIKINRVGFRVIGVLPEKGANGWRDQDDVIVIPVNTAMHRLLGKNFIDYIEVEAASPEQMDNVENSLTNLMNSRHRLVPSQADDGFRVRNMADIKDAIQQSNKTMGMLLAVIAAISLVVGGIGIMNIMLVSVTERTREIGLRKAVGASRRDISAQFLVESVVVSALGGLGGIALGWTITTALGKFAGWAVSVAPSAAIMSFLFSASIGIIFGLYPARKASALAPIDALRSE